MNDIRDIFTATQEAKNRHPYTPRKEWQHIRERILKRANHQCEFCGVQNYTVRKNARIVLSVAHLDQQPENNHPKNLAALCQRCHLLHDQPFRMYHSWQTRFNRRHSHTHDLFEYYSL